MVQANATELAASIGRAGDAMAAVHQAAKDAAEAARAEPKPDDEPTDEPGPADTEAKP
jgi:septal ring factor EnvC (AmiA/AmiB activator)